MKLRKWMKTLVKMKKMEKKCENCENGVKIVEKRKWRKIEDN